MAFLTEIVRPTNRPFLIFQLDKGQFQDFFTPRSPYVHFVNFLNSYPNIAANYLVGIEAKDISSVGSVTVDGVRLLSVPTQAECESITGSFYWNGAAKELDVHFPNDKPWYCFAEIKIGISIGWSKGWAGYWNNIYYYDILKSVPSINKAKPDIWATNPLNLHSGSFTLDNRRGSLDTFILDNAEYIGNAARCFLGFLDKDGVPDFDDLRTIAIGYLESVDVDTDSITFHVKNSIDNLTAPLPNRVLDPTIWTNLDDNNQNKPIPLLYGKVRKIPCICINEKESPAPANYQFLICDTSIHSAIESTSVKPYKDDDTQTSVTAKTVLYDNTNHIAYFEIPAADYTPGEKIYITGWTGAAEEDIKGYVSNGSLMEEAIEIIIALFENYYGIPYSTTFWDTSRVSSAYDLKIGLYISEKKKFVEWIAEIVRSSYINFNQTDDGKYYAKIFNKNEATVQGIDNNKLKEKTTFAEGKDKLFAKINIEYSKDYQENKSKSYIDDTMEDQVSFNYSTNEEKKIPTLINNLSDAQSFATQFLDEFGQPRKTGKLATTLSTILREPGDRIKVTFERPMSPNLGTWDCEIEKIEKDFNNCINYLYYRMVQEILDMVFSNANYYDDCMYDDGCLYTDDIYFLA